MIILTIGILLILPIMAYGIKYEINKFEKRQEERFEKMLDIIEKKLRAN